MVSFDCDVVGQVADGTVLLSETIRLQPDVLLLDLNLPNINCLHACSAIRQSSPVTKVIVLTGGFDPELGPDLLRAGAAAFFAKNTAAGELLAAIIDAHRSS